jgi:hypothetical protein
MIEARFGDDQPENSELCQAEPNSHPWLICQVCFHAKHVELELDCQAMEADPHGCDCEVCGSAATCWRTTNDIRPLAMAAAANADLALLMRTVKDIIPICSVAEVLERHGFHLEAWGAPRTADGQVHYDVGEGMRLHLQWGRKHAIGFTVSAYVGRL